MQVKLNILGRVYRLITAFILYLNLVFLYCI